MSEHIRNTLVLCIVLEKLKVIKLVYGFNLVCEAPIGAIPITARGSSFYIIEKGSCPHGVQ